MSRNKLSIIVLFISLIALLFMLGKELFPDRYNDFVLEESKYNEIKNKRSTTDQAIDLKIDGCNLIYDSKSNIYYCSLNEVSQNDLNPEVSFQRGYMIAISDSLTREKIRNNQSFGILIYDSKCYCELNIKFTTLPLANILLENQTITSISQNCNICIYDNRIEAIQKKTNYISTIKTRGASSLSYDKKGFSFTVEAHGENGKVEATDDNTNILGLRCGTDYILYAAYNDQEKVRNVFSSNLWYESCATNNEFNLNNGMRYEYVELFINNEYWGLYAMGFPIDERQLGINPNDISENIYKKINWSNETGIDFNNITENIPIEGYEIKTKNSSWATLYNYYRTINNGDSVYADLDIGNHVDVSLFCSLIMNVDGPHGCSMKNTYLITKNNFGNRKILYCPWDLDLTWGNEWVSTVKNYTLTYFLGADSDIGFYQYAYNGFTDEEKEEFNELLKERYKELRNGKWANEEIIDAISEYENDIFYSGAYRRDMERWPKGTYQDEGLGLSIFKEYVLARLDYFDEVINNIGV